MEKIYLINEKDLFGFLEKITIEKPKTEEEDTFLTTEEACNLAKVSRPTIHRWRKSGLLHAVKIGKNVRFRKNDILEVLSPKMKGCSR